MMTSPGEKHLLYLNQFAFFLVSSVNKYFKFKAEICGCFSATEPFCAKCSDIFFFTMHLGKRILCQWCWSYIKQNLSPQQTWFCNKNTRQVLNILYPNVNCPKFCCFRCEESEPNRKQKILMTQEFQKQFWILTFCSFRLL